MVVKMSKSSNFSRYRRMEIKLSDGTTHLIALRVKIFVIPRRIMSTVNDRVVDVCFICCNFVVDDLLFVVLVEVFVVVARPQLQERIIYR